MPQSSGCFDRFRVKAVRSTEMRTRCLVMTWQELAGLAPEGLREFFGG